MLDGAFFDRSPVGVFCRVVRQHRYGLFFETKLLFQCGDVRVVRLEQPIATLLELQDRHALGVLFVLLPERSISFGSYDATTVCDERRAEGLVTRRIVLHERHIGRRIRVHAGARRVCKGKRIRCGEFVRSRFERQCRYFGLQACGDLRCRRIRRRIEGHGRCRTFLEFDARLENAWLGIFPRRVTIAEAALRQTNGAGDIRRFAEAHFYGRHVRRRVLERNFCGDRCRRCACFRRPIGCGRDKPIDGCANAFFAIGRGVCPGELVREFARGERALEREFRGVGSAAVFRIDQAFHNERSRCDEQTGQHGDVDFVGQGGGFGKTNRQVDRADVADFLFGDDGVGILCVRTLLLSGATETKAEREQTRDDLLLIVHGGFSEEKGPSRTGQNARTLAREGTGRQWVTWTCGKTLV